MEVRVKLWFGYIVDDVVIVKWVVCVEFLKMWRNVYMLMLIEKSRM